MNIKIRKSIFSKKEIILGSILILLYILPQLLLHVEWRYYIILYLISYYTFSFKIEEYLKNKDSFDFFSPLLKKAKQGNDFAFMGLINLDKVEMVETKHSPTDYRKKDIIYKLPNGEYVKKHFGIEIDPWENSSFEEEYVEFSFVEPVEKTIIEWKEKKK